MPIKAEPRITAWSYSRLQVYKQCPFKCRMAHLPWNGQRVKEPEGPAVVRGKVIETEVLDYLFGAKDAKLPESGARFPTELAILKKMRSRVRSKVKLGFNRAWKVVDYFAPDVWTRMEFDLIFEDLLPGQKKHYRAHIIDLKTGKIYPDKFDQFELYNLVALILPEDIITHKPELSFAEGWYLDQGEIAGETTLMKSDIAKQIKRWEKEADKLLSETAWQPRPNNMCRFCFYRKDNKASGGGQCPY